MDPLPIWDRLLYVSERAGGEEQDYQSAKSLLMEADLEANCGIGMNF